MKSRSHFPYTVTLVFPYVMVYSSPCAYLLRIRKVQSSDIGLTSDVSTNTFSLFSPGKGAMELQLTSIVFFRIHCSFLDVFDVYVYINQRDAQMLVNSLYFFVK